uniref:UmuC domain-containing protein n=1 Tax=Heterorhabditis bacteriophora TaxID=37862 RepID=A0A1I7XES1_HETBA
MVLSISADRLLDVNEYLLLTTQQKPSIITAFHQHIDLPISSGSGRKVDQHSTFTAKDSNFLEEYYARSRLHLISTLAQEMKDYVNGMRDEQNHEFIGRHQLEHISDHNWKGSLDRVIFHVDLDCFFVSVSLRSRPDLVGKAVAVTHSKGSSRAAGFSELASVSYVARVAGLRNGMLVRDALKLCPTLICLPYEFNEYKIISKAIYTIVSRYTLDIRAVSCDEMYIDCTKLFKLLNISDATLFAEHLRSEIKRETGCPASIGIGSNMLMARLATRYAKPDNVKWVKPDAALNFITNEKVENLPGLGYCTLNKLRTVYGNLKQCGDLQKISGVDLEKIIGKRLGEQVYKMCRGEDETDKDFVVSTGRKSVSCDINYGIRFTKMEEVVHFLNVIGQELEKKLNQAKMVTGSITLKIMIGVQCSRLISSMSSRYSVKAEAMNRLFRVKKSSQEKTKAKECQFLFGLFLHLILY